MCLPDKEHIRPSQMLDSGDKGRNMNWKQKLETLKPTVSIFSHRT